MAQSQRGALDPRAAGCLSVVAFVVLVGVIWGFQNAFAVGVGLIVAACVVLPLAVMFWEIFAPPGQRMTPQNTHVHGAARPASDAEAQTAARGAAKAQEIHEQKFPE